MIQIQLKDAPPVSAGVVVRTVPQQREVIRGVWQGQSVYVKRFMGTSARRHFLRDLAGIEQLTRANIATPALLFQGMTQDESSYLAVFQAIAHVKNAEEDYRHSDTPARFQLMKQLVAAVASHHCAGLIQTDLYLKNFLVDAHLVYTLDGDGIRHLSRVFGARQKLCNLATLFSKMDVLDDVWIAGLVACYCEEMGLESATLSHAHVGMLTQKIRSKVMSQYADRKVFRTCTDVKVTKNFWCYVAVAKGYELLNLAVENLDLMLSDKSTNLKNGRTCTVAQGCIANAAMVIKRYNMKNFWHALNRAFRPSRAAKSWANAHRLLMCNIATPAPIALIEERLGCLRSRAYYLSEYVDAPDVLQFFTQTASVESKQIVARNLAALFYKLYLLRFSHGDCKATNIKVLNNEPVLIDLDGMHTHAHGGFLKFWFRRRHVKDLKRLMKNWEHDVETAALLKGALAERYNARPSRETALILQRAGICSS